MQSSREKLTYALCWTARIWGVLILIITILAVASQLISPETETQPGVYRSGLNFIPVIMLTSVLGLAVAWKWKLAGALLNLGSFGLNLLIYWIIQGQFLPLPVILVLSPIYIPGILFLVCWYLTRTAQEDELNLDAPTG